jgi:phosphoenolpyruvate carboxylase
LADDSWKAFVELVESPDMRMLLSRATPYDRLGALTIGSRPPSRAGGGDADPSERGRLRAIPWVLCWTQTRYLLHAWLGIGTAWRHLRREPGAAAKLRREMRRDPLLRAYMRTIGFTLAKTAPTVWDEYLRVLASDVSPKVIRRLDRERRDALDLARCASPDGELLFDRRWLLESIRYRAPMIHPLNLLQIGTLDRARKGRLRKIDDELFRESVTGIAAGMLTTG